MNSKIAERLMREKLRFKNYANSTEQSYISWCKRYMRFLVRNKPIGDSTKKVETYLTHLAKVEDVSAATQNQALNSILFLYRYVIKEDIGKLRALRAREKHNKRHAPSMKNVAAILDEVQDSSGYPIKLICKMLYGCGMRVNEPLNLRIKDICFERQEILMKNTKGAKDRFARIPDCLVQPLKHQVEVARAKWKIDSAAKLPVQLDRAYRWKAPSYQYAFGWYWLFPLHKPSQCPRTGRMVRWHVLDKNVQREVRRAAKALNLDGQITPHNLRHAWATHLLNKGANPRDIQEALGHKSLETTMIYLHGETDRLTSPLDQLSA